MNQNINIARATVSMSDLFEALVALKHDKAHTVIHLDSVEEYFFDLARELGFAVYPLSVRASAGHPVGANLHE